MTRKNERINACMLSETDRSGDADMSERKYPISNGLRGQCHEKSAAFNHTSICSYLTLYNVHAFKLKQRELFLRN